MVIVIFHKSKLLVGQEELLFELSIISIKSPEHREVFAEGLLRIGFGRSYTTTIQLDVLEQSFSSVTVTDMFFVPHVEKINSGFSEEDEVPLT